jgi:LL-diaminopimelate aminotransferase
MVKLNPHFAKLSGDYLFPEVEKRAAVVRDKNSLLPLLNLGIGDVTNPLAPTLLAALCTASQEMGHANTFRGYGPSQGYLFLRESIARGEYQHLGISPDEIFISDGGKCDLANIQELFATENRVCVTDPTYPVCVDSNIIAGRMDIHRVPCLEENGHLPLPPQDEICDLIYLCSPNNPTGVALNRKVLRAWIDYAILHQSVILFDGAYEAFVCSEDCPSSIYEIPGAKEVAIEIRSFSKTAGFTGLRCSYTVIPKELRIDGQSLHAWWRRRHDTKFGGVPYPIQKCAAAIYSPLGKKEVAELIKIYHTRAHFLSLGLKKLGYTVYGGVDAPYIWLKTPGGATSWEFFDELLNEARIISIPGRGFGEQGEGYVRLSALAEPSLLAESLLRFKQL